MLIWKHEPKWFNKNVGVVFRKTYKKRLPFYFVIRMDEPGVKKHSDGDIVVPNKSFIKKDKKGNAYVVPSENGDHIIILEQWSGSRGYKYTSYSKTAILESLHMSNGRGDGEYWAVVPVGAKSDEELEAAEAIEDELKGA